MSIHAEFVRDLIFECVQTLDAFDATPKSPKSNNRISQKSKD